MLSVLKKIHLFADPLTKLARKGNPEVFIHELCGSNIYVIAKGNYDDGLPKDTSATKIMTIVEKEATRINMQNSLEVYVYTEDDKNTLPFFSSSENAEVFCSAMSKKYNKIFPFTVLMVSGQALCKYATARLDIVLNDKTPQRYILSNKELALLLALGRH
tara:strand:- start:43 stop:522 length:480 start_codon:yes stop_codon:yes gene_type:complete